MQLVSQDSKVILFCSGAVEEALSAAESVLQGKTEKAKKASVKERLL